MTLDASATVRLMPRMPAILEDALIDKILAGERITQHDARELYRMPLVELGELAAGKVRALTKAERTALEAI